MGCFSRWALILVFPLVSGCSIRSQHDLIQSETLIHKFLYDQWTLEEIEDRYERTRADTRDLIQRLRESRKRNQQLYRELQGEIQSLGTLEGRREEMARLKGISAQLQKQKAQLLAQIGKLRKEIDQLKLKASQEQRKVDAAKSDSKKKK
ncbi:MAG: hypothetical protein QF752_15045 [Planctomycetota bacterium]|nr:hypothetical protein [Planctomycetota bacterium]